MWRRLKVSSSAGAQLEHTPQSIPVNYNFSGKTHLKRIKMLAIFLLKNGCTLFGGVVLYLRYGIVTHDIDFCAPVHVFHTVLGMLRTHFHIEYKLQSEFTPLKI